MWFVKKNQITVLFIALICSSNTNFSNHAYAYSQTQFDSVSTEQDEQVNRVRDQEISQIKIVLGRRYLESRKPDILLRLAELYIEKYRFYFFKENEIHQKLYKGGHRPKKVDHVKSHSYLNSATNACLAILKSKVPFSKLDQVYYFLGYNAEEKGNHREAVKYFNIVISKYPHSTYAAEAYRNLAEDAFSDLKYTRAIHYYEKAAAYTNLPSYPRTLYKLAWSYFKTRRKSEALNTMKRVVESTGGNDKFVGLHEEALNDLVLFYSEAGRSQEAREYFSRLNGGSDFYVKGLSKLSGVYERRGDYKLALKMNNELIEEYESKKPELIVELLGKNVELYKKANNPAGEEAALSKLVQIFSKNSAEFKNDVRGDEDTRNTYNRTKSYLRSRSTEIHKEAQKKKDKKLYSRAADLYSLYLKAFFSRRDTEKERKEFSEIKTYRSDCLLAAGREQEAVSELELVLKSDGDLKNRKEAGATLLNILIKSIDSNRKKSSEYSDVERKFVELANYFEETFPSDKLVAELKYKKARLAAEKSGGQGLSKDARKSLLEMIELYPSRPESADSAHELVADLVKKNESNQATELSETFLKNTTLLSADKTHSLEKYLRSVVSHQSFELVQDIEKDKDYSKAAREYERLGRASSNDHEVSYKAFNNAAVNYERAGEIEETTRVLFYMLDRFSSNPAPKADLKRLASLMLWKSQFQQSSKLYAKLASLSAYTLEERMSFSKTAFTIDWATGNLPTAFVTGNRASRELCDSKLAGEDRCHELQLDLARVMIDANRFQEALNHLRGYVSHKTSNLRKAEANFMIATIYQHMHEQKKASIYLEDAAQSVEVRSPGKPHNKRKSRQLELSNSPRERNFAAHAAFLLVEPYFSKFNAIQLEMPEQRLKAATRQKLSELESLVTRYQSVVNYGDGEWGIAALERLFDAFSSFALDLERAPVPSQLDAQGKQRYQNSIRQISGPMFARAGEYLSLAYKTGSELKVTTPTFIALTQRQAKRSAREFPPAHYVIMRGLKLMGPTVDDNSESRRQVAAKLTQNPKNPDVWVEFGNLELQAGRARLARLLYEQAVSLNSKHFPALNNLAIVLYNEKKYVEATESLEKALQINEFSKEIKLNLAEMLLSFHHFRPAYEHLRILASRFPDDDQVSADLGVAALGIGQLQHAANIFEKLDARSSKQFSLWYNWAVVALLGGDKNQKEKAIDLLRDRRDGSAAAEKNQIELVLSIFGRKE